MQHGLEEEAPSSTVLSVLHLQPDMHCHWFLSLFFITGNSTGQSTGIPVCAAMVTWATALCGGSHQGFYRGWTEMRDIWKREKCVQKGFMWENKAGEIESECKQVRKEVEILRDKQGEGEPQQSVGQQSHMAIHYQRCRWLQACYWDSQSKYWLQLEQALFRTLAQASPPLFPSAAIYLTRTNG